MLNDSKLTMARSLWVRPVLAMLTGAALAAAGASACAQSAAPGVVTTAKAEVAPDAFIRTLSNDVMSAVKQDRAIQNGDTQKVVSLVDAKILPHVNFQRMTASAVGRYWRQATPEQQKRLQNEFKSLLVYTYSGAVSQIKDQVIDVKPPRSRPGDTEVLVRTLVRGKGDPIQLDYRLEKTADGWKIYDVNVLGAWLVATYQSSFAQEVTASGIDGLITKLAERNKQLASKKTAG